MTIGEVLSAEMAWLAKVVDSRMRIYFQLEVTHAAIDEIKPPELTGETVYGMTAQKLSFEERIIVALALAPHVKPQLLDAFFMDNATYHRRFTEFGGATPENHTGFLPTGDTALFIIAGDDIDKRINALQMLTTGQLTGNDGLIKLFPAPAGEPLTCGLLSCTDAFIRILFDLGKLA